MYHYEEYLKKSNGTIKSNPKKKLDKINEPVTLSSFDNNFNHDDDLIFYLEMDIVDDNKNLSID